MSSSALLISAPRRKAPDGAPQTPVASSDTRAVLALAGPIVLNNTFTWASGFLNVFMVSRLGQAELAALGMSNQLVFMLGILVFGVTTGTTTLVARARGAGDEAAASDVLRQSILLALAQAAVTGAIGVAAAPWLLRAMGAEAAVAAAGTVYLRVMFVGLAASTLDFTIASAFRGAGDSVTPLRIGTAVILMQVTGNYLLIFGIGPLPALGITGAALSSVLARSAGVCWAWRRLRRGTGGVQLLPGAWQIDRALMRRVLRLGLPAAAETFLRSSAYVVLTGVVARSGAGAAALAANTVGLQVESLSRGASLAVGTAATSLVGRRMGAGDVDAAARIGWRAAWVGMGMLALLSALQGAFAPAIAALFTDDAATRALIAQYLRILALGQPFYAAAMALGGALRGGGDTRSPLWGTILSGWLFLIPVSYLLVMPLHLGTWAAWAAQAANYAIFAGLMAWRFRAGRWRSIQV